jgi:aspartate/methionine/tyrosine aminotransferase
MRHVAALSGKAEYHTPFESHGFSKYSQMAGRRCAAAIGPNFATPVLPSTGIGESFARRTAAIAPNDKGPRFLS